MSPIMVREILNGQTTEVGVRRMFVDGTLGWLGPFATVEAARSCAAEITDPAVFDILIYA